MIEYNCIRNNILVERSGIYEAKYIRVSTSSQLLHY